MTARLSRIMFALFLAASVALTGCAEGDVDEIDADTTMAGTDTTGMATAQLEPTEGNNVTGDVTFTSADGAVRIEADVQHLALGQHGFHIHENGDCSAPDASSAGEHFNPTGQQHGAPTDSARHVGDLGNVEAGPDSTATYSRVDSVITLSGPNSIVGRAVVVHSGEDDLTSQPSGNAGERVACGVIEDGGGMAPGGVMPGQPVPPGAAPGAATDTL